MKTHFKTKVLTLALVAICLVTCGIISIKMQTKVSAYTESVVADVGAGNSNDYEGWDLSSINKSKTKSSNPTGNYFYTNYTAGSFWAISTPITERKDLVLELDWETNGDGNHFIQFGPWSSPDVHEFNPVAFNYNWGAGIYNQTPGAYTLTVQDLTNAESQPQTVDLYSYGFIQGYRYRFTFDVTGDLYIAKRPIGSTEEFVDELKVVNFQVAPETISEASPRIFRFHMFQYVVLGDLLLRYKDGTVIQQCMFDREHVFAYANRHPYPGYFTSDHTNGVIYENKPYLQNLTQDEKLISEIIVDDNANLEEGKQFLTFEGCYDRYDMDIGKSLNFLFGLPEDLEEAKKATWNSEGVSCISMNWDGANFWVNGYYEGNKVGGPGLAVGVGHEFLVKAIKKADGTTTMELHCKTCGGRLGMDVPNISGRVAIQVGGETANNISNIRFVGLSLSTYKQFEGTNKGVNFNSYDDSAINAKIDENDWFINATPASQFADSSLAKGLNVTADGKLFFEGTSDGTAIAPKGQYGNFVLEFDYYDFASKPEQVESWVYGYSPLGIGLGRDQANRGWDGINKLITIADSVSIQCFDEGAFSATNSANINFKDVWTRIKIVVINDKISVYTASLENKEYVEITAEDYTLVAEAQFNSVTGYVSICGTESAYFKLDNIRITNIDDAETTFVDGVEIADKYTDVTVTAVSSNEANGTVTGTTTVVAGTSVTLTATVTTGCNFEGWFDGETKVSDATEYTFTATANKTLTAKFSKIKFTVTATAENGTISGAGEYEEGSSATLTATANEGYRFVKWTLNGQDAGTEATINVTVSGNVEYVAIFEKITYTLTVVAENGTVTGAGSYDAGATVTLTVTVNEGYEFVGWYVGETKVSSETTYTFVINEDVAIMVECVEKTPVESTETESEQPVESTESENTSTSSGCASGIGTGSIFALAMIMGAVKVFRKKED